MTESRASSTDGTTLRLTLDLPAAAEDEAAAALAEAGTLGLEVLPLPGGRCRLLAYFTADPPPDLAAPLAALGARWVALEPLAAADWMAPWRRWAVPFAAGRRFWIDPREPAEAAPAPACPPPGRILLRLPARQAFGTGTHESTRLALELLEDCELAGRRVLDVGTGSGVLAFAALALGARAAVGVEADPVACLLAGSNRGLNRPAPALLCGRLGALTARPAFDVVVANLESELLVPELGPIAIRLAAGGTAIFSGVLWAEVERFTAALQAAGFRAAERRRLGDWAGLRAMGSGR